MRLLIFSILLIGIFPFPSCKKEKGSFVIKGSVTDLTLDQPLAGAVIKLYQVPVGSSFEEYLGSAVVAGDGTYSLSFERNKMEKYVLRISKPNYFELEEIVFFSSLSLEEDNVRNYGTTAKSWVKIRLLNQNPQPGDTFIYSKQQGKSGCAECCESGQQYFYGALDTTFYCINDGNEVYSFLYALSGTSFSGIEETTTVPFDTVELYLPY
jgi:hypothetical protein